MTGTVNQIDWAGRINARVDGSLIAAEIEGIKAGRAGSNGYSRRDRNPRRKARWCDGEGTRPAISSCWRELNDQVQQMITQDSQYEAIKADRARR